MVGSVCGKQQSQDQFPPTLAGFGYKFNEDRKLVSIKTGEGFQFVVKEGDQSYNQRHYEALGEVVTEEVYRLLETECGLRKQPVPIAASEGEPSTFIFVSEDVESNEEKLLVLIHGSGVVRAGQWARRLIINDSLDSGTMIPFIKRAQQEGYGVLLMNTNDNYRVDWQKNTRTKIKGSENPERHALYVWQQYVMKAPARHVAVMAHSYGGCVTTALFTSNQEDFVKRVFAVAMTDSVHYMLNPALFKHLIKISCNWVCSPSPLDTPVAQGRQDIPRVSAGVTVHEETSWASFSSVFRFLSKRLQAAQTGDGPHASVAVEEKNSGTNKTLETEQRQEEEEMETAGQDPKARRSYGGPDMSDEEEGDEGEQEGGAKKMKMQT